MSRVVIAAAVALALVAACGDDDQNTRGAGELTVVASFYPVAHAAGEVGGGVVEVTNLTPAGTEPHDLELTTDQVDTLLDADLVLYLGEGFQPAVEDVIDQRDGPSVDLLDGNTGEADDPHLWLDPTLMAASVDRIEEALAEADPDHASTFAANAASYRAELEALDAEFDAGLRECARRVFVTAHAAFHYLAARYDLEQLPIAGLSPESEPTPDRLAELTDVITEEGVTTVFYETLVSPSVAETLAREAGVGTGVLNPLEGLTEGEVDAGEDYLSVMRKNLSALRQALGCR